MKKIFTILVLVCLMFAPVINQVEAAEMSAAERQAKMQQIQQLQALLAQLLAQRQAIGGTSGQTTGSSHSFKTSDFDLSFSYRYDHPLTVQKIKYTKEDLEQLAKLGFETEEWGIGRGRNYVGILTISGEVMIESLQAVYKMLDLASMFTLESDSKRVVHEKLSSRNGFAVNYIGQIDGLDQYGTFVGLKEIRDGKDTYALVVRVIHANYRPDGVIQGSLTKYYDRFLIADKNKAKRVFDSIADSITVDENEVARRIDNDLTLSDLVENKLGDLDEARDKAKDARKKDSLSGLRASAELYYDDNGNSYNYLCNDRDIGYILDSTGASCDDKSTAYKIYAPLTEGYFCVDSTGYAGEMKKRPPHGYSCSDMEENETVMRAVNRDDHIIGKRNADVVLVTYTDLDCPFCKNFHETMNEIVSEYDDDEVAWVYRNFPLGRLHPNARHLAEAAECVADLEGNDEYWKFVDLIFGEREVSERTNISLLSDFANRVGVDENDFEDCLEDGDTEKLVQKDYEEGVKIGVRGTPHTVVIADGDNGVINGAQPYDVVKSMIDDLLAQR